MVIAVLHKGRSNTGNAETFKELHDFQADLENGFAKN